jgi:hypothetical protein
MRSSGWSGTDGGMYIHTSIGYACLLGVCTTYVETWRGMS